MYYHGQWNNITIYLPGVGVHRTLFKSFCAFCPDESHLIPITSARLAAAVPKAERSSSLLAAGVKFPGASAFFGVEEGGCIEPFFELEPRGLVPGVRPRPLSPIIPALSRRLLAALLDRRLEIRSREDMSRRWNGESDTDMWSSDCEIIRGVPERVPQVISWFTAREPSSAGVGEGTLGTSEKLLVVGDLGRSAGSALVYVLPETRLQYLHGVPVIAASMRLGVGLGGTDCERPRLGSPSSISRVPSCLIDFGLGRTGLKLVGP